MKKKNVPPPPAPSQPILNEVLLLRHLSFHGFTSLSGSANLLVAEVQKVMTDVESPYGIATHMGTEIRFRKSHFHRVDTEFPSENNGVPAPYKGNVIWVLAGKAESARSSIPNVIALAWGYVTELPSEYMVKKTPGVWFAKKLDFAISWMRKWSWSKELRRQARAHL